MCSLSRFRHAMWSRPFALLVLLLLAVSPAAAQDRQIKIWDVPMGTPVAALDPQFIEPACGTNGGPPSQPLARFADFAICPADTRGLREIWFRYDDALEFIALAYRNPVLAMQYRFNAVNGQMAIFSFLVDGEGHIRGYRIFTDPKAPERERYDAHVVSATLRAIAGKPWDCRELSPGPGEEPIEGNFVKSRCTLEAGQRHATLTADFYLKPGQQVLDSNAKRMVNAFASAASLEVVDFSDVAQIGGSVPPVAPAAAGTAEARFLAGESKDCPGCTLAGADLRYRDLTGADLTGANLAGAVLHRAVLKSATLAGANLDTANLNAADLTLADFTGADLSGALLYRARGSQPIFDKATLDGARLGDIELRRARFAGASLKKADLGGARLNDAVLSGAALAGSYFYQASFLRAQFDDAQAVGANFTEANLRQASLARANFTDVDFQKADLQDADLADAVMIHVRLTRANLRNADTTGADFTGAAMP